MKDKNKIDKANHEALAAKLSARTIRVIGKVINKFSAGIISELQEQADYIVELEAKVGDIPKIKADAIREASSCAESFDSFGELAITYENLNEFANKVERGKA